MSVLTGSNPLNAAAWADPQKLAARCLNAVAETGGPRCCKRTSRLSIHEAVLFTSELLGVTMPEEPVQCTYMKENRECIGWNCPYFPK